MLCTSGFRDDVTLAVMGHMVLAAPGLSPMSMHALLLIFSDTKMDSSLVSCTKLHLNAFCAVVSGQ